MVCGLFCHKSLKTTPKSLLPLLATLLAGPAACSTPPASDSPDSVYPAPVAVARMAEPANRETSGLAASTRTPGLVWTHNDSGGTPVLYALDTATGALRGRVRIAGVINTDWEDIDAFTLDGRSWLLVADTGDNHARRPRVGLHVIEEPSAEALAAGGEITVLPAYSIHFVYEHGARDCEAVAVDPRERAVWLLSKRDTPARLYRLPLQPATADLPAAARFIGSVPHLRHPDALQRLLQVPLGAMIGMPTALAFAPDGSAAAVVLYGDMLLFPRRADETWAEALAREPVKLPPHRLPQAEAATFSADGRHLYVASELDDRLLRYDLP